MVKSIKTVKQLEKHIGETLHVVSREGYEFDATVETTGKSADSWCILKTTDMKADKDRFWWKQDGKVWHNCAHDYQITKELNSLTTIGKKKTVRVLTKDELDAARGHFCLLKDGSKGFICTKTESSEKPTRVLHNSSDCESWNYTETEMPEDDAPETIKHDFTRAYNVWGDGEAASLKVVKILEKYDGRKYRFKKAKKTEEKKKECTPKKTQEFLNKEQIADGVGHFCIMADGSEGYIARTKSGTPLVLHNADITCDGWRFDPEDYDCTKEDKELCDKYKRAWWVNHESDSKGVKVVKILDTQPEEKSTESTKKSVLDLTVRELLEKLDEIVKR